MADESKQYGDPADDPGKNDDAQPSVTSVEQVIRESERRAGVPAREAKIPAPADAIDLAYRTAIADTDAQEIGKAVAAAASSGTPSEEIDVEAMGEGSPASPVTRASMTATEDVGTGPYEGRSVTQLKALAASKGLPTSGSKDELVERLRG